MNRRRLYTRGGDRGMTSLVGGARVSKSDARVEAYGSIDEVCAFVGAARAEALQAAIADVGSRAFLVETLDRCQEALMRVAAQVATPDGPAPASVDEQDVADVESAIDRIQDLVKPLDRFILPGGTRLEAALHVARTVCRRAERRAVALQSDRSDDVAVRYLNRLSDLLFALARLAAMLEGAEDRVWEPRRPPRG